MKFFDVFNKKAENEDWPKFFIDLIDFLGGLQWVSNSDDQLKDTYFSIIPEKDINGGLKITVSVIKNDDIHCTINVGHHEDIIVMSVYCLMDDNRVQLYGFYKHEKNIEAEIDSVKLRDVIKKKFDEFYNKLVKSRMSKVS